MYEINTDKMVMVCMTMIRIYVVNVAAGIKRTSDIYSCEPAKDTLKV